MTVLIINEQIIKTTYWFMRAWQVVSVLCMPSISKWPATYHKEVWATMLFHLSFRCFQVPYFIMHFLQKQTKSTIVPFLARNPKAICANLNLLADLYFAVYFALLHMSHVGRPPLMLWRYFKVSKVFCTLSVQETYQNLYMTPRFKGRQNILFGNMGF